MEIVITAMTRVNNMVCLAGINLQDYTWVRPVWRHGAGVWPGVNYQSNALIEVGDVIWLKNPEPHPVPLHSEDVLTSSFSWVRTMDDEELAVTLRQAVVNCHALDEVMSGEGHRSLCLIKPDQLEVLYVDPADRANTRIGFWLDARHYNNITTKPGFPCTDLRWRAYRRQYGRDLDIYQYDEVFLAIGLTRPYNGLCNPMVVSVITLPSFRFTLDPNNL